MNCIKCNSLRIIEINAKCSDCCNIEINDKEHDGYVPYDINIGGGDYIRFSFCLNCGFIQNQFPLPLSSLESK